ncbi:MAG TPA: prolyl-tRNA synthetase associated domain-containing protein [Bacteroidales bacterium]|jgi:Ala-tRNA(Pro) deacylase|nr:prolyl-tRNA synthetase associated domain-containing protein [Bacteroidales bacterium]
MNGDPKLYAILEKLQINYQYIEHPPAPTIHIAKQYWEGHDAKHCKNLFFRNHKGDKHFIVILDCDRNMDIHAIEKQLHQGKLSFASEQRLRTYLGLSPGSVTPFGLINDTHKHVHLFIDENLRQAKKLSFHPCINTASLLIDTTDFIKFLQYCGNTYEWITLY